MLYVVFPGALKRVEIMGTERTAIQEESNLIKWEFAKAKREDKIIKKTLAAGNTSQGGVSDPADISFVGHQKQIENMIHSIETGDSP